MKIYRKVPGVDGADVADRQLSDNTVYNLGDGATMSGNGKKDRFDISIEIGTAGVGSDFIRTTAFIVKGIALSDVHVTQEFEGRLTTVGRAIDQRKQSSKVVGNAASCLGRCLFVPCPLL